MEFELQLAGQTFARLVAVSIGVALMLAAVGYLPTVRIAGRGAVPEMLAGIGISLFAGIVGAVPVARSAAAGDPKQIPIAVLLATAIRFIVVLALTVAAVFSGWFDRAPLVLWVGIAYLVMLLVDTVYAVRIVGTAGQEQK